MNNRPVKCRNTIFFYAHARQYLISTSGLKSDVTIAFLPDFLYVTREFRRFFWRKSIEKCDHDSA